LIETNKFGAKLKRMGYDFYSGVPCSFLEALINYSINECRYIKASGEGEVVAIAAGAYLGGSKPVVLMQNSGLTNAISPLSSLIYPFHIPLLGFVSLRGEPGLADEPQHELMGQITEQMLTLLNIKWEYLSFNPDEAIIQLQAADETIMNNTPFFFIVRSGTFEPEPLRNQDTTASVNLLKQPKRNKDQFPTRYEALGVINELKDESTVMLATTGKTGRELYTLEDAPNHLYMVGSMGCVSSLGLGLSLKRSDKQVIAIDGDGALLMRMGSLAVNGHYSPPNLLHVLLDNNAHDSTGGQQTVSHTVNFVEAAAACGYENAIYIHHLDELKAAIAAWQKKPKLTFLHMKIAKGSLKNLGRPQMKPYEIKERLQVFLND
jgi:phosphonopyruvate decarboxylase